MNDKTPTSGTESEGWEVMFRQCPNNPAGGFVGKYTDRQRCAICSVFYEDHTPLIRQSDADRKLAEANERYQRANEEVITCGRVIDKSDTRYRTLVEGVRKTYESRHSREDSDTRWTDLFALLDREVKG